MKKVYRMFLFSLVLLGLAGCGNTEDKEKNVKKDERPDKVENVVKEVAYTCEHTKYKDVAYTFYFTDDVLTKVDLEYSSLTVYDLFKEKAKNDYESITVTKDDNNVYVEVDMSKNGKKFLYEETIFYDDESYGLEWSGIEELMTLEGHVCVKK